MHSTTIRRQLTLFLEEEDSIMFELFRREYNPIQHGLIPCHVTLCREDELHDVMQLYQNATTLTNPPCTIQFNQPSRFENGHGLWLRGKANNDAFHELRKKILKGIIEHPRITEPHLTLIHPRNGNCTDDIFESCRKIIFPEQLTFHNISLIEQTNGGIWQRIQEFNL